MATGIVCLQRPCHSSGMPCSRLVVAVPCPRVLRHPRQPNPYPRHNASVVTLLGVARSCTWGLTDLLLSSPPDVDLQAVCGLLGLLLAAAVSPLLDASPRPVVATQTAAVGAGWAVGAAGSGPGDTWGCKDSIQPTSGYHCAPSAVQRPTAPAARDHKRPTQLRASSSSTPGSNTDTNSSSSSSLGSSSSAAAGAASATALTQQAAALGQLPADPPPLDAVALAAQMLAVDTAEQQLTASLDEEEEAGAADPLLLLPDHARVGQQELSLAVGLLRQAGVDEDAVLGTPATGEGLQQRVHRLLLLLSTRPTTGSSSTAVPGTAGSTGGSSGSTESTTTTSSSRKGVQDSFWGEEEDWEDVRGALMSLGLDQGLESSWEEEDASRWEGPTRPHALHRLPKFDATTAQQLGEVLQELRVRHGAAQLRAAGGEEAEGAAAATADEESSEEAAWWAAVGEAYQRVWEEARTARSLA